MFWLNTSLKNSCAIHSYVLLTVLLEYILLTVLLKYLNESLTKILIVFSGAVTI